ncbi:MAG: tripartite tricarboxylate transporter substrate binding protein [Burkholderiales bacterium]
MQRANVLWSLLAAFLTLGTAAAYAQTTVPGAGTYPNRPIRFILPFAPGGGTDVVARLFADRVAQELGQQVVIDNRPSAGGIVGTQMGVQAEPDGYTLLMGLPVTITVAPALFKKLPYDPLKDLAPVGLAGSSAYVLAVHPSVAAKSVQELIAAAKAKPGMLGYAAGTVGAGNHLAAELFKSMTKTDLLYVPYKGGGPALIGVFSGEAQVIFGSMLTTVPHVRSGKLRALGVTSSARATALPEVPTIAEAGVPGYEVPVWFAIFVPRKTPQAIVSLLNAQIVKLMNDPRAKATLAGQGFEARATTPQELGAMLRAETAKWVRVVKEAGVKAE